MKGGLRKSFIIGTLLVIASSIVRLVPIVAGSLPSANVSYLFVGQFLNACVGPIVGSSPSLLSAKWFPESEGARATAVAVTSSLVGTSMYLCHCWPPLSNPFLILSLLCLAFAFIVGPLLAPATSSVPNLLWFQFGLALLLLPMAIYMPEAPLQPPIEAEDYKVDHLKGSVFTTRLNVPTPVLKVCSCF